MKAMKPYAICYPDPLELKVGELVRIIKSEPPHSEWFGWHFCMNLQGKEGWISNDFLEISSSNGKLVKPYSAKELAAQPNEEFNIKSESCGWYWVENQDGEEGWLPKNIF